MRRVLTTIALGARYASSLSTKRKILVLHGKGGSGASMKLRFQGIENALPEFDFTYATAPHELDGGGYQWWTLPPGVRSFQATEYGGVDAALDVVRSSQADVVWGHSQGAILLGFAAAIDAIDWLGGAKLILNGASWPKPYEAEPPRGCRGDTLHVLRRDGRHQSTRASAAPGGVFRRCARFCPPGRPLRAHGRGRHRVLSRLPPVWCRVRLSIACVIRCASGHDRADPELAGQ